MPERNLCVESGCLAYCCHGPTFPPLETSLEQVLKWFPEAKRTRVFSSIGKKRGVYFKIKEGTKLVYRIKIVGYCPNVDESFNCRLEEGDKPAVCRDFPLGQDDCNAVRLSYLLPTFREWNYQQSKLKKKGI